MHPLTTFDSTKESLGDLLASIAQGKTQLPDFQRGWVWDDEHIRGLIASLSMAYPVGAVMMLETGGVDIRFKPRPVEGSHPPADLQPERLIMDGQQRLTSMFRALKSQTVVDTRDARKKPLKRWYYIDIIRAIDDNADREESIFSIPEDRQIRNFRGEAERDLSSQSLECAAAAFPCRLLFDQAGLMAWQMAFITQDATQMAARSAIWTEFMVEVLNPILQYQVPMIRLKKETPKEAVCTVFERVNTGGVPLTVFELLTATYAADGFDLRADWEKRKAVFDQYDILQGTEQNDLLQAISLMVTKARRDQAILSGIAPEQAPGIGCKRRDLLRLTGPEYQMWAEQVTNGFIHAAKLVRSLKFFAERDLPYRSQLTSAAAIFVCLRERAEHSGVLTKIARWYWCGVFGELYGGGSETQLAKDLPEVLGWIDGADEPSAIQQGTFSASRLLGLRTRNSAAYKGIYALLMKDGCQDLRSGATIDAQVYFDDGIDIHHLFPQDWCEKQHISPKLYDSILNKTAISAKTNRSVGGKAPSEYLAKLEHVAQITSAAMDVILRSHGIDPVYMRTDDPWAMWTARSEALLARIEAAMGKAAAHDLGDLRRPSDD